MTTTRPRLRLVVTDELGIVRGACGGGRAGQKAAPLVRDGCSPIFEKLTPSFFAPPVAEAPSSSDPAALEPVARWCVGIEGSWPPGRAAKPHVSHLSLFHSQTGASPTKSATRSRRPRCTWWGASGWTKASEIIDGKRSGVVLSRRRFIHPLSPSFQAPPYSPWAGPTAPST